MRAREAGLVNEGPFPGCLLGDQGPKLCSSDPQRYRGKITCQPKS